MTEGHTLDFPAIWHDAIPYERFVAEAEELQKLWLGIYDRFVVPAWALEQAAVTDGTRLLCITEDWCWDAANSVPPVAKLCEQSGRMELRVVKRDENLEVMDHYLTNGTRSIPVVVVLNDGFRELGSWGPRPRELQKWAMEHKDTMSKKDFYVAMRRWHLKDKGESTLQEVLEKGQ